MSSSGLQQIVQVPTSNFIVSECKNLSKVNNFELSFLQCSIYIYLSPFRPVWPFPECSVPGMSPLSNAQASQTNTDTDQVIDQCDIHHKINTFTPQHMEELLIYRLI